MGNNDNKNSQHICKCFSKTIIFRTRNVYSFVNGADRSLSEADALCQVVWKSHWLPLAEDLHNQALVLVVLSFSFSPTKIGMENPLHWRARRISNEVWLKPKRFAALTQLEKKQSWTAVQSSSIQGLVSALSTVLLLCSIKGKRSLTQ